MCELLTSIVSCLQTLFKVEKHNIHLNENTALVNGERLGTTCMFRKKTLSKSEMRCTFANTTEHRERFLLQYILRYAVISRETYLKGIYKSTKKLFRYFSSSSYATSNSSQLMEKHCVLR